MRLRVFRALISAGPQSLTPSDLCATLDVPASTLSFHLKELLARFRRGLRPGCAAGLHSALIPHHDTHTYSRSPP